MSNEPHPNDPRIQSKETLLKWYAREKKSADTWRSDFLRVSNQLAAMTEAKDKALEMLRCTDDGPRTRECYNAVTGRDFDKDIAELEKVK